LAVHSQTLIFGHKKIRNSAGVEAKFDILIYQSSLYSLH
jgi:hypothetical protein